MYYSNHWAIVIFVIFLHCLNYISYISKGAKAKNTKNHIFYKRVGPHHWIWWWRWWQTLLMRIIWSTDLFTYHQFWLQSSSSNHVHWIDPGYADLVHVIASFIYIFYFTHLPLTTHINPFRSRKSLIDKKKLPRII